MNVLVYVWNEEATLPATIIGRANLAEQLCAYQLVGAFPGVFLGFVGGPFHDAALMLAARCNRDDDALGWIYPATLDRFSRLGLRGRHLRGCGSNRGSAETRRDHQQGSHVYPQAHAIYLIIVAR